MSVIFILLAASLLLAGAFLIAFLWALKGGQYEDTCTPAMRVVLEDDDED